MREIKFRAKIKYNGNHRFSGDWVIGYYWYSEITEKHYIKESEDVDDLGTYEHSDFEIDVDTLGQCTGLKDKNDNEIYEGDIIHCLGGEEHHCCREYNFTGELIYSYGSFNLKDKKNVHYYLFEHVDEIYTIGNIHENPELLI
jgi:uncharacterized phage protein (TIGR01671 family)